MYKYPYSKPKLKIFITRVGREYSSQINDNQLIIRKFYEKQKTKQKKKGTGSFQWSHSVAVSTTDFESVNSGSNPDETLFSSHFMKIKREQ